MPDKRGPDRPDPSPSDIPRGGWVDRYASRAIRPYIRLARLDRPIGSWLLLFPCWWAIALASPDPLTPEFAALFILFGIGAVTMRGAGCTYNDICDRDFDAQVARTRDRPLPAGEVTIVQAGLFMGVLLAIGFAVLISFNPFAIGVGVASLVLVFTYPLMKRVTFWPQFFLGLAFNWGALLAWVAHAGSLSAPPLLLYASGIAWTLFYDTIYAHQDREDDALIGIKSTARLFGARTGKWLGLFLMSAVTLMTLALLAALLPDANPLKLMLALAAPWGFGWHMLWQMQRLDIDRPEVCLRLFRANRETGLIAALFLAASALA